MRTTIAAGPDAFWENPHSDGFSNPYPDYWMQRLGWTLCLLAVLVMLVAPVMLCTHGSDGLGGIATAQADSSHHKVHDASTCVFCAWRHHREAVTCTAYGGWQVDHPLQSTLVPETVALPESGPKQTTWARGPPTLS